MAGVAGVAGVALRSWVVMGVSGCGKSAVGQLLAARLGLPYAEGDDDHPAANVAKMAAGMALDDADRHGWLLVLQGRLRAARQAGHGLVLSCSALKRSYRDLLREGDPGVAFAHLSGTPELIGARLRARHGHFMPPALLTSQFDTLQALQPDERGLVLDVRLSPVVLAEQVVASPLAELPA